MLVQRRQYRVNQILILNIEVDIFDNKIPDAKQVEEVKILKSKKLGQVICA